MKKKIFAMAGSLALVAAIGVGSTLAYFTDNDKAVNVVTTGHVDISVSEETTAEKNVEITKDGLNFSHVVPGDTISKIVNINVEKGSEDAYVRVKLNPTWTSNSALNEVAPLIVCGDGINGHVEGEFTDFIDLYWTNFDEQGNPTNSESEGTGLGEGWIYSKEDNAWYYCERVIVPAQQTVHHDAEGYYEQAGWKWGQYGWYWSNGGFVETKPAYDEEVTVDSVVTRLKALPAETTVNLFENVSIPAAWTNAVADATFEIAIDVEAIQSAHVISDVTFDENGGNTQWPDVKIEKYEGSTPVVAPGTPQ